MLLQIGSKVNVPTPIQGVLENLRSLLAPGPVTFHLSLGNAIFKQFYLLKCLSSMGTEERELSASCHQSPCSH